MLVKSTRFLGFGPDNPGSFSADPETTGNDAKMIKTIENIRKLHTLLSGESIHAINNEPTNVPDQQES